MKRGEITINEGLNHANMVNMVTEGVHAALAEHKPSEAQANMMTKTEKL